MTTTTFNPAVAMLLAGLLSITWLVQMSSSPNVAQLDPIEAFRLLQKGQAIILDVRERDAYGKEHLPDAVSIPIGELQGRLDEIKAADAEHIVVYCNDGSRRGPRATAMLNQAGLSQAKNLRGGIEAWRSAAYQTVKPG